MDKDLLDRPMEGRSPGDLSGKTGMLSELTKALAERALSTEMDVHLDEERIGEATEGQNQAPNRRNWRSQKTVTTDSGKVVLDIPRHRNELMRWMGQRDIRRRLIIRAVTVVRWAARKGAPEGSWLARMLAHKRRMLVAVALANRMARTAWALMRTGENYRDPAVAAA